MNFTKPLLLAALAAAPAVVPGSAARPDEDMPLVKILQNLEESGYDPLVDVSLDDGNWEVEAYRGRVSLELTVDTRTGEILSEHRDDSEPRPPQGSLKLSEVVAALEKAGYEQIDEASFERRYWEVEAIRDNSKRELHVDPKTAEVISDRLDD